jgi:hypothetical protein
MLASKKISKNKFENLLLCALLMGLFLVPTFSISEETSNVRKSKEYPLVPRYTFSGDKDGHCELWSDERESGQAATCRRRAAKPSTKPILCRFKRSYINDDDETLTMCVYEKAGYNMEDFTISSETYICEKEFKCKR